MAICDIPQGGDVIKYGFRIGNAKENIKAGSVGAMYTISKQHRRSAHLYLRAGKTEEKKTEERTFMGFARPDGSVGVRNEVWIVPTVGCVNNIATAMANVPTQRYMALWRK